MFDLLLIENIFSKNATKQKTKRKKNVKVKPWLKTDLYASVFNNVLAETKMLYAGLIVNGT